MRPRRDTDKNNSRFTLNLNQSSDSDDVESPRRRRIAFTNKLFILMAGQSRKWMILVVTIWIQAFTGTNFDFSQYSSSLKSALGISQAQLNYLATANDMGKVFGWSSGLALMHLPVSVVMFVAAFMGFLGYGLQWLLINHFISFSYFLVFLLCLLSGCSICWFNTVCFVLCIRNFPVNRTLALSLTVSFNGVSAALYTLAANSIDPSSNALYLLLNALVPLFVCIAALIPILRQPPLDPLPPDAVNRDSLIFLILNFLAIFTGLYLLLFGSFASSVASARLHFAGTILLLILPLFIPGIVYARAWARRTIHSSFRVEGSSFILIHDDDLELHKELLSRHSSVVGNGDAYSYNSVVGNGDAYSLLSDNGSMFSSQKAGNSDNCCERMIGQDQLTMLGEDHTAAVIVRRSDFWLYYITYFCGGTIGLVYNNNLGQIAQSLGLSSSTSTLVTLYASFSFFGRLLSAGPDYIRSKFYFARTGWLSIALIPTPMAFFLLAASDSSLALHTGTALIGLSSGFIFAAAVSVTSELFGPNSVGVNHNILITNIPIGSLLYGFLAALVYDANANSTPGNLTTSDSVVCMGRQCYFWTFVWWGCISVLGLGSSFLLFLRTKHAYDHFEKHRISTQVIVS
ncbi:protein NUCLEAR FUSION DEFECTIVE 4 [Cicer arietinum]|uniref:Protein NUCLEAR FUSION DEFECTIVE 4 n=1 Tax=Cicer arietinum TaxID=3827 RepID=A0A1S2YT77_CICAR|nr:protein NUCLEAR FUSION DEFECTIVE 4 [Cicer arietinum]